MKATEAHCEPEGSLSDGQKAQVPVQGNHLNFSSFSVFSSCKMRDDQVNLPDSECSGMRMETMHHRTAVSMFSHLKKSVAFIQTLPLDAKFIKLAGLQQQHAVGLHVRPRPGGGAAPPRP